MIKPRRLSNPNHLAPFTTKFHPWFIMFLLYKPNSGIRKKSEISTEERTVVKLDITCLQLLSSFLLSFPSLLLSLSPFFFPSLCPSFLPSLPKLICMKEGVMRPPYIFKTEYVFKMFTWMCMCVIISSLQKTLWGVDIKSYIILHLTPS